MDIRKVGIVGAGQMGNGIAHVFALAGHDVVLNDISQESLDKAMALIARNMERQVSREKITAGEREAALARIRPSLDIAEAAKTDLVIEAATENEAVKNRIFEQLQPGKIHGISFHESRSGDAARGIDPGHRHQRGNLRHLQAGGEAPRQDGRHGRMPMINEAVYALYEGVGSVRSIDTSLKLGANHPMGPLELADFIGLDTCLAIMNVLHDGLADTKYRPCPLLTKYVEAGWLGRKTKRGFYDYRGEEPVPTR